MSTEIERKQKLAQMVNHRPGDEPLLINDAIAQERQRCAGIVESLKVELDDLRGYAMDIKYETDKLIDSKIKEINADGE